MYYHEHNGVINSVIGSDSSTSHRCCYHGAFIFSIDCKLHPVEWHRSYGIDENALVALAKGLVDKFKRHIALLLAKMNPSNYAESICEI